DVMEGVIVETEAYYGLDDPASRVYHGIKDYNRLMLGEPGRVFVYNVHNNWMLNIVAHEPGRIGAVLIRAVEPTSGIEAMRRNRPVTNVLELTNGPGKLSKALKVRKALNGIAVFSQESEVTISSQEGEAGFKIGSSHRIGVRRDLERKLRFFIEGNRFISR
ncbi:MAG: DNA-3-methyladenine glycosylase, partial [Candidatus Bathyarchaeia archaeon]